MPDPWLWCSLGFQGLVGMMKELDQLGVKPGGAAIQRLEEFHAQLTKLIAEQKAKAQSQP